MRHRRISRRDFLRGSAAGAVFFAMTGWSAALSESGGAQAEEALDTETIEYSGDYAEKEKKQEGTLRDRDALYEDDDETSVITMYLTVNSGNEGDGTNHTWTEVNSYSAYYYDEEGIDRYKVEGILQVGDEDGPLEGEYGYGETIPNVTVQIRGQTSSRSAQKNYKVRIKDGKGEWRKQRTIALNKHVSDALRFSNKLAYDLMKEIPQLISARTQFVHLYVKDLTAGGSGEYEDYGLFTQVEQMNKTYLENHGLDRNGQFYKINFFEWQEYEAVMKLSTDPEYDEKAFEEYLEIKGSDDHSKLIALIEELNDYTIPIQTIVDTHFDLENLSYWMAFQILIGNYDTGARNAYIYSALNSDKWYFISWDNDAAFSRTYYEWKDYSEGLSWERGMTQFLGLILFNRMFRVEEYRQALDDAVKDLKTHHLAEEQVDEKVQAYADVVRGYLYQEPDVVYAKVDEEKYDTMVDQIASEIELNYQYYLEQLEKPWPFYVGIPEKNADGTYSLTWDLSYDVDGEEITYDVKIATDYKMKKLIFEENNVRIPQVQLGSLSMGVYYMQVTAVNESGFRQDCFDYGNLDSGGKLYGIKVISIDEKGDGKAFTDRIVTDADEEE
ncbi:MAG: CotH kinase family protein [Lachnospiraceae bacterium]|nr:CotH kinase family protein [Lachnospiraceae bacterium]